jgi:hypothetical protein
VVLLHDEQRANARILSRSPSPRGEELHRDLREVMRNLRPDFDLGAPGLREAWDRGEREQFLVSPVEGEAIRYTEGTEVGVKR